MAGSKKKKILPLVFLLIAIALMGTAYVLLSDYKKEKKEEIPEENLTGEEAITAYEPFQKTEIQNIRIENETSDFTLIRVDENWLLEGEEEFPVNQPRVEMLADYFSNLQFTKSITEIDAVSEYGLDQPKIKMEMTKTDGSVISVEVGDLQDTISQYYIMVNGDQDTVYLGDTMIFTYLSFDKKDMMPLPSLSAIEATSITRLSIQSEEYGNLNMYYEENNPYDYTGFTYFPWVIEEPFDTPQNAETEDVTSFLEAYKDISFMAAVDYKEENWKNYGIDTPSTILSISYQKEVTPATDTAAAVTEPAKLILSFGNPDEDGNVYVRMEGSSMVYLMGKSKVEALLQDPSALVTSMLHLVNIESLSGMEVIADDQSHQYTMGYKTETVADGLESKAADFTADGVSVVEGETEFRELYNTIVSLKKEGDFPADAEYEEKPYLTVKFIRNDVSLPDIIVEYLPYNESYYAVRWNGEVKYTVDARDISKCVETINNYKAK